MAVNLADNIFNSIFLNENVQISIKISLKFIPKGPIDNKSALFQVMAWRRTGDKPLPESMLTQFTRGRWVNIYWVYVTETWPCYDGIPKPKDIKC